MFKPSSAQQALKHPLSASQAPDVEEKSRQVRGSIDQFDKTTIDYDRTSQNQSTSQDNSFLSIQQMIQYNFQRFYNVFLLPFLINFYFGTHPFLGVSRLSANGSSVLFCRGKCFKSSQGGVFYCFGCETSLHLGLKRCKVRAAVCPTELLLSLEYVSMTRLIRYFV